MNRKEKELAIKKMAAIWLEVDENVINKVFVDYDQAWNDNEREFIVSLNSNNNTDEKYKKAYENTLLKISITTMLSPWSNINKDIKIENGLHIKSCKPIYEKIRKEEEKDKLNKKIIEIVCKSVNTTLDQIKKLSILKQVSSFEYYCYLELKNGNISLFLLGISDLYHDGWEISNLRNHLKWNNIIG